MDFNALIQSCEVIGELDTGLLDPVLIAALLVIIKSAILLFLNLFFIISVGSFVVSNVNIKHLRVILLNSWNRL